MQSCRKLFCIVLLVCTVATVTSTNAWCSDGMVNPITGLTEYHSENGVLNVTLEAKPQKIAFNNISFDGYTFNDQYGGPVLRVHPGDVMHITLINHLPFPTNIHFHGLHASPLGHGDNIHVKVYPGESFEYVIPVPLTQPQGLYWYHSHYHGNSDKQVMGGLSGALVVEGLKEQFPELANIQDRIFVLKDYSDDDSKDPVMRNIYHHRIESINGQLLTNITMHPGETQLWRFSNQSSDLNFRIALKNHKFRIIATDGDAAEHETVTDAIDIFPAQRIEALVDAGPPGTYELISALSPTGTGKDYTLDRNMGKVTVEGSQDEPVPPLEKFPDKESLMRNKINYYRTIVFSQDVDADRYYLNYKLFDENRIDTRVPLGNTELWTIRNDSDDMHVFHIHQLHFQVVDINNVPQPFNGFIDTVRVPERGFVRIRIAFTDPHMVGRFVYHCHILEHEDKGMMGQIEVYDPKKSSATHLWNDMGYCCTGQFSMRCVLSNLVLLTKEAFKG